MTLAKSQPIIDHDDYNHFPEVITEHQSPVSEAEMLQAVRTLLLGLGEDPDREGLRAEMLNLYIKLYILADENRRSLREIKFPSCEKIKLT
jgi:GTP cyclohydrolase I